MKKINKELIFEMIMQYGPISKPQIKDITKLSLPTVNKIVDLLEEEDKVKAIENTNQDVGRKPKVYVVNDALANIICCYFKQGRFICYLTDMMKNIIYNSYIEVNESNQNEVEMMIFKEIDELIGHKTGDVKIIGIGVPGVVNNQNIIYNIPSIPKWEKYNLKKATEERYNINTYVENDVKLMTLGFYESRLKEKYRDIVYIYIDKCMGGAMILNGEIYKGFSSFAGEIGSMLVDYTDILGNKHTVFLEEYMEGMTNHKKQDSYKGIMDALIRSLVNVICVVNPEVIVLESILINQSIIEKIKEQLLNWIKEEDLPEILCGNEKVVGLKGLLDICWKYSFDNMKGK